MPVGAPTRVDPAEIRRALGLLAEPGGVAELRVPHASGTASGYFNDLDRLAGAAASWSGRAAGIYITLNPVAPALLARAANRVRERLGKHDSTTSDGDVLRRRWLALDFDPARPAGVASSDAEHTAALARAETVRAWLTARGWPVPLLADSGNGAHLLYRLDLSNDADATELVKRVLAALDLQWSDERVQLDTGVYNAARVWKLYGTVAAKGDHTPDRPHRVARLLDVPPALGVISREQLAAVAAMAPPLAPGNGRPSGPALDVAAWLAEHGVEVTKQKPWNGGMLYELTRCVFNPEHSGTARVVQFANGALSAGCFHASCAGRGWRDLRALLEPGGNGAGARGPRVAAGDELRESEPVVVPAAEIEPERVAWLWPGRIARGKITLLIGDPGLGKSYTTLDIAARLSRGGPWPDAGLAPLGPTLLLSAEDGPADTIRPRLDLLGADATRVHLFRAIRDQDGERHVSLARDLPALERAIAERRAALVVIDPLSAYLGDTESYNDSEVRGLLAPLAALAERTGVAVLAVMHLTKDQQRRTIHRALGSVAFVAAARVVLVVARDLEDEERRLLLSVKNNLSAPAAGLGFRLDGAGLSWEPGTVAVEADVVLSAPAGGAERDERRDADQFLRGALAEGEVASNGLLRGAEANGISRATLFRAKRRLGVRARHEGQPGRAGRWYWSLPPLPSEGSHNEESHPKSLIPENVRLFGEATAETGKNGADLLEESHAAGSETLRARGETLREPLAAAEWLE